MRWHDVWILYRRELRSAFRERAIVTNSILMPIFLYPVMMWVMFTGAVFVRGLAEGRVSRVVVQGRPAGHPEVMDSLRADEELAVDTSDVAIEDAIRMVELGELDAVVEFLPAEGDAAELGDNFAVLVSYDRAVERSRRALARIEGIVSEQRGRWMEEAAASLGVSAAEREQFRIVSENVSSGRQMGALLLGFMIPLFVVLMVALGCFMPSIDSTAGERERSTWETLLTVSASRLSVVTAKYLYVATLGIAAGCLNVVAMFVSLGAILAPLVGDLGAAELQFRIVPLAVPVMIAGAVVLALLFSSAMMILASFARTFKDGQAMVTPVYWLALLPIILGQQTDRTLDATIAAIPVANVAMMMRDAINGVFLWPWIIETLAVNLVVVAGCLLLARSVLRFEDFLLGSFDGSLWRFVKDRFRRRSAAASARG